MKAIGVIPARLGSTRLAEKVLKPIAGKPMIQHVWERSKQAKRLDEVYIATDDARVLQCAEKFGAKALLTSPEHPNGTSRVAEVAAKMNADIVINVQGDEPVIHPEAIDQLASVLFDQPGLKVATLAVRKSGAAEHENPNVVKVVCSAEGNALYFSRSPLPYFRNKPAGEVRFLKHLGIYGYRRDFLLEFVSWPSSRLEKCEQLEQLRILDRGIPMRIVETEFDSLSVDVADDIVAVEMKLQSS